MKSLKIVALIMLLLITVPTLAILKPASAAAVNFNVRPVPVSPLTDIDPSPYILTTPRTPSPVGQYFTVEIHLTGATAANVPNGVQGVEVHFYFGNILEYAVPTGFENFLGRPAEGGVLNPAVLYGIDACFYDDLGNKVDTPPYTGATYYKVAAASSGAAWNGEDGLVAKITFQIIKQPSLMLSEPDVSFDLALTFTDAADSMIAPIPHDRINGELNILAAPYEYPPRPQIFVEPAAKTGTMGEIFTVNVKIRGEDGLGVSDFWDVAGFDITFTYDPTLISLVSATEGNFLKQHGEATWGWIDTTTPGIVWAVFTKLENDVPSSGIDTLLTMQFEVIYEHDSYPPLTCDLGLTNTVLASWAHPERIVPPWEGRITAVELPYDPTGTIEWGHSTVGGTYKSPYVIPGPAIDVYTQYPEPYGGQGANEHSDAFAPQMLVYLYAKVTYGGDRVTNKWVTFEVHNALGEKVTILANKTDWDGIAVVSFRIPQTDYPCGHDPAIFGWWNITATVEIDEVVVSDTLTFQVGWLVEVVSVEPLNAPYKKYVDNMEFKVTVKTISEQVRHAIITVDPFDTAGNPIGEALWEDDFKATRVSGDPYGTIPGIYEKTLTIPIPTWARVGTGTVTAIALTDFPRNGGSAYCPIVSEQFTIKVS
ncbi:MAG: cohesin domain-containing protein [Candidatus Bathyarchaeia archaeon]